MSKFLSYAVLGRGRWAGVVSRILEEQGRRTVHLGDVRRGPTEPESEYRKRLCRDLTRSAVQAAWLCVSPGPHVPVMIEAALRAGVHVIVEKPWLCSRSDTERLSLLAREKRLQVGFDYEYCLIAEIEHWRRELDDGTEMMFSGCFWVSRSDRLGISALENLGSHLAAVWAYAVPKATISELNCKYDAENRRNVRLEQRGRLVASLDFYGLNEPLIPRLIERFESGIAGSDFSFDLCFAARVAQALADYRRSRTVES